MKSEGYHYYERVSRVAHEFINEFTRRKNEALHGKEAINSEYVDNITEKLVNRDLKIACRFSVLLRDQEWKGYLEKVHARQQKSWAFELQLHEKTLVEKQEELEKLEAQKHRILKDKEDVEMDTMREGFRNVLKSKFFNEWRVTKQ